MDRLIALLDQISEQIWKTDLDDDVSESLRARCSQLEAQIAVQHALQKTVSFVLKNGTSSNAQSRICKFLDTLYGDTKQVNANLDAKWQCLRDLDCGTFLLIAASYTPLEVTKMSRTEFDYLVRNAASYAKSKSVPSSWMFRKEVQLAMVEKSDLPNIRSFKKCYHDLEYSDYVPTAKRRRIVSDQACVDEDTQTSWESECSPRPYSRSTEPQLHRTNTEAHSPGTLERTNGITQINWKTSEGTQSSEDSTVDPVDPPPAVVPHSELYLGITDLVRFLERFQDSCPELKMTCPWLGIPLPFIDMPLNPSNSVTAKIELSLQACEAIVQDVLALRGLTTDVSH